MRGKNTQMTKVIAVILSIALVVGMLPSSFVTAQAANEQQMGTLSAITTGGAITGASEEEATATYNTDTLTLEWAPAYSEIGRVSDGWWVGIKMTAPSNMTTEADFANVYYQTGQGEEWSENKSFWNAQDSDKTNPDTERYLTMWGKVNEEILNNALTSGKTIDYRWQFDWDGDGAFEQKANLKIDPAKVVLNDEAGMQVYPSTAGNGTVSAISDGLEVQGTSNANIVKVLYTTNQTLTWCEKDESVGRYNDGWWAGFKITAPTDRTTADELADVKYQSRNGNTWSEAKSFWDNQDSDKNNPDTERYLTMWGLLNESLLNAAVSNEKNMTYSWRFDWNDDGVYEQVLLLEIDPSMVVLNDADGNQVYPELGVVSPISGGSVTGVTGNTVVTADELTLNWSPKNTDIGRNKDGWWAGIKITAPEGMAESQLEGVQYQRLLYGESAWKDKSFWGAKDSKEGDASHFMEMWMHLTPAIIDEAKQAGTNITNQYRFDWNQDGVFEQLVTFTVVPSDKIVLTKVEQTGFKFETEAPEDQWVGKTYINTATGGEGTGAVTYSIEEGSEFGDVNATTGEVTFKEVGRVTVKATKAADDTYAEATATYSVTSMKLPQEEFKFATTGPVTITYKENGTYSNQASGGDGTGDIKYKITSGDCATIDETTGEVKIVKAGTVTVEATKDADDLYEGKVVTYSLTINKADQAPIVISSPTEITYSPTLYTDLLTYSGGNGKGEVKYEIIDGKDVATVDTKDGKGTITTLKAGTFTVKLTIGEDDCYNAKDATATIVVNHADQETFKFSKEGTQTVTYNENENKFSNPAVGGESVSTELTYRIVSAGDYASIDETTGEVTIKKAGTVTIEATKGGDDCYNSDTIEYTLIINRAEQSFSFVDGKEISKLYGTTEYTNKATEKEVSDAADGKGYGVNPITYSIVDGGDDIGAKIDSETGKITIGDSQDKEGTITVKATKAQDDCYNEYSDTYELLISYLETPKTPYTFSDENKGEAGWYTGTVKILAAPGYEISYDNEITTADWKEYVEFDVEKINKATVYLRDADGFMSDAIVTEDIKIDTANPTDLSISYREPVWREVLEGITFGAYKAPLDVTISAKDANSGIDYLTYNIGGEDITISKAGLTVVDADTVSYTFTIEPQFRNEISMSATDVSGRTTDLKDGKTLIVDTETPTIKVDYEYKSESYKEYKGVVYTEQDTIVYFEITESNFDVAEEPVVTVNDDEVDVTWDDDDKDGIWKAKYVLSGDGDYVVKVTFSDRSEHEMEAYESKQIRIDNTIPEIKVDYKPSEADGYYATPCEVTVQVKEHNFLAENVDIKVTAKDVSGASIAKESEIATELEKYLIDINNWEKDSESDTYTAVLPAFDEDAQYTFTVDCEDIVGNEAEQYESPEPFVIDQTKPTNLNIEYSEAITPWWQELASAITFGYYNPKSEIEKPLVLTLTADDITSGIDYLVLNYMKEAGTSDSNEKDSTITISSDKLTRSIDGKTVTFIREEGAERRGSYKLTAFDKAGNSIELNHSDRINVVDTVAPKRTVTYSDARVLNATTMLGVTSFVEGDNVILYYETEADVTIDIEEANFYKEDVTVSVTRDGADYPVTVAWSDVNTDEHQGTFKLSGNGDYQVKVTYKDRSNNEMVAYESQKIAIDDVDPTISVEYKSTVEGTNEKYYKADRTAEITIEEHNFRADDVVATVTAKDVTGADIAEAEKIAEEVKAHLSNRDSWNSVGDKHVAYLPFTVDAEYVLTIDYRDIIGNPAETYVSDPFVVDHKAPTNLTIDYSDEIKFWEEVKEALTLGYYSYNPDVVVTITAEDITSGVDYFEWEYTREAGVSTTKNVAEESGKIIKKSSDGAKLNEISYSTDGKTATTSFKLTADEAKQYRGHISFTATDRAGNTSNNLDDKTRINVVDTIDPERTVTYSDARVLDATTLLDVSSFVEGDNVILYYETEAEVIINIKEANFYKEDVTVSVTRDEADYPVTVAWNDVSIDEHVGTFKLSGNGDYQVKVTYKDRSNNEMVTYTSQKIAIDDVDPTISVEYTSTVEAANEKYYKADRTAEITIEEHNFRADDVVATVTAKDVTGADIAEAEKIAEEVKAHLSNRDNWNSDGDKHVAYLPFTVDAEYVLTIDYKDIIGNPAETYVSDPFVVDHKAPTDLTIDYSDEIKFWEEVKEAITFGYYSYNPDVVVTITADDITSGVDYFEWKYTREDGVSTEKNVAEESGKIIKKSSEGAKLNEISYSADGKTATTSFKLTADEAKQYRGNISFTATDRAGNTSESLDDNTRSNIVDTISPTRVVTYSDANKVVDATTLLTVDEYNYAGEDTNAILYYNDKVTATFKITEANFYEEDVVIKVNDVEKAPTDWIQNGDEWTGTITIEEEGDHIVTMTYTDRSNNEMLQYASQRIVIDKTAPVVSVDYANKDVKNTVKDDEGHNRQYFDKVQTATITIKEHNFRADDVVLKVNAKNIVGSDVSVTDYKAQGINRAEWEKLTAYEDEWRRVDDTYQLVVTYPVDANYTFDIEYKDLATNSIANYEADYFTVDTTAPTNLKASYSTNILEKVIQSVTFGYYNAQMTVTIQADDETAGIYHFMYSYLKSNNVSSVNAELLNQAIADAKITREGKTSTTTFTIPEKILQSNNQFNGTIEFTAYDRSENRTFKADDVRVVVDNISPTTQVTYNEPIQNANGISYYAGDINATVVINEANFYSEDVVVRVTRDGQAVSVPVTWVDNSVDVHTGTFTLSGDGDYFVTIEYTDRSLNKMVTYTSNELTIDTQTPTIQVLPIKMNSANKDEVFGFTITANDTNFDAASFKPVLTAVLREEDGTYKTVEISLGDIQVVTDGQTYTYSIANLEQDAVYSLKCTVKDMAGNEYSMINLSDGNQYEEVTFSVNREGSTYYVDENTKEIIEKYYVYSVDNDIVIEEVNVDPVENYVVKLNGKALKEGTDYTTRLSDNTGEWSKRIYMLNKSLFEEEGEYNIVVESTDKANTTAYSDVKGLKIAFVVDQTKPVVTISGLETSGRYQVEEQIVTVIPTDDGGRLNSFKVIVYDRNGNPLKDENGKDISVRFDMSGEELLKYLEEHDGKITFTIPEGLENQVQIICNDCAVNAEGLTNEYNETFAQVTVSQSGLVIYYANKPLFYGSIAAVLALIGGIIWLIVYKKKKNEEEE